MPRLGFRLRLFLFLLAVSLPPLIGFGAIALVGTTTAADAVSARLVDDAMRATRAALEAPSAAAAAEIHRIAADAGLARAAVEGDRAAAAAAYNAKAGALTNWSAAILGDEPLLLHGDRQPPDGLDRVAALDGAGLLVAGADLWDTASSALSATVPDAAGLHLVVWQEALGRMSATAGDGGLAIVAGSSLVSAGRAAEAAAAALDVGTPAEFSGTADLPMADGSAGRLAVVVPPVASGMDMGVVLLVAGLAAAVLAAILAGVLGRTLGRDLRAMAETTERVRGGEFTVPSSPVGSDELARLAGAQQRLAASLEERNRQIHELASQFWATPISARAGDVAWHVLSAARRVTGNPTWSLAVLRTPDPEVLVAGSYVAAEGDGQALSRAVEPLTDLHRWATVATMPDESAADGRRSRHAIGPWGAFVVVDASASEDIGAVLLAPWEGRAEPSAAELDLFGLVGQQAAAALEHTLLYARLRAQTDELNRLAAVQSDFLRGVTHDLQTPLTSIRALAEEIGGQAELGAAARGDLETIAHQADRLRRMVGQLLAVGRLEAGALEPRQEVFRVDPIVRRTWEALRAGNPFAIETVGPMQLAVGDPDRLEQVLWAVLDNAVKYSPAESEITVHIGAEPAHSPGQPSWSEIAVTDRGPGMDSTLQDRAFDQFFRSDDARRAAPDGSGIGLYAARGLVEAMGGSIQLESRPAEGTTVRIRLPAEPVDGGEEA